ncbi:hypothetical protein EVAR_13732_1 [Eumeta japonica]|uniref:Uncharacterized protein n=1 Tax=Eumeta variegata TaxID=151549 RepID=A0A4C1UBG1_EUMVA|nr:hypothetical protein EVAR_13732_1 [Eumeta japonica]
MRFGNTAGSEIAIIKFENIGARARPAAHFDAVPNFWADATASGPSSSDLPVSSSGRKQILVMATHRHNAVRGSTSRSNHLIGMLQYASKPATRFPQTSPFAFARCLSNSMELIIMIKPRSFAQYG